MLWNILIFLIWKCWLHTLLFWYHLRYELLCGTFRWWALWCICCPSHTSISTWIISLINSISIYHIFFNKSINQFIRVLLPLPYKTTKVRGKWSIWATFLVWREVRFNRFICWLKGSILSVVKQFNASYSNWLLLWY